MAGNKVNAKAKGKDDRSKGSNKPVVPNDENEETDFSLLRKPIQTSITGFAQARKIFDMATEELKSLLSDECDLLYECKVCRNLFRSLANFISHKRVYCKDKFNSTVHGHFVKVYSTQTELSRIERTEEGYQASLKEENKSEAMDTDEVDERIPMSKDLTGIIENIAKNKGICEISEEPQVTLQKIPNSAVAVFQTVDMSVEKDCENMRAQVNELDNILSRNVAVLQNDGNFKIQNSGPDDVETPTDGVIQISDDEDGVDTDDLKCKKCDMQFSTQKTLKFHMKYKHVDTRVVYPCPDCLEIFSTSWSVYRHLFKVHRKTPAQIRRLRESILAKSFKMNNPPAFYEKRKNNMKNQVAPKITEEERLDQENQAWMDNMECDGEVPRCGGCGRTFERRAALAAHTHTCQPRSRALARRPETKRIEIQIRKDYNKGPAPVVLPVRTTDVNENKTAKETKEIKDNKEENKPKVKTKKETVVEAVPEQKVEEAPIPVPVEEDQSSNSSVSPEKMDTEPQNRPKSVRLPYAQLAERSNLMALRQRVIPDTDLDNMRCKKCDAQFDHIHDLYDHVAKHYNWVRYACKLCNFKHYNFDKLPEHVKVVHKLKGDKDFYFSTVKAIDGPEAAELAAPDDANDGEASPESRRPSRCSSDSSRFSDDSSSSSTKVEGARKRKMQKESKEIGKRRKSVKGKDDDDWTEKNESPSNVKAFEENSSDVDDTYEKVVKKSSEGSSVASRRPIRRKAKPKSADFEYDLSNLLKMEAQGYRDSQTVSTNTKPSQTKKKNQTDSMSNYKMLNKECCGALVQMSRKAVEKAEAHMKTASTFYTSREQLPSSIFVRPLLPRSLIRSDKVSPKKDGDEKKDSSVPNKETKEFLTIDLEKEATYKPSDKPADKPIEISPEKPVDKPSSSTPSKDDTIEAETSSASEIPADNNEKKSSSKIENSKDQKDTNVIKIEKTKPKSINIPAIVPIKFRRQSLDVMKNPIINKNITEFTKAGMKTKILVIKPINRKKDGIQTVSNTPMKFQTIKLKEANKSSTSYEEKSSDQVVVVKVPNVDCVNRTGSDTAGTKGPCEKVSVIKRTERVPSANDESGKNEMSKSENTNAERNGEVIKENPKPNEIDCNKINEIKSNLHENASAKKNFINKTNSGDDPKISTSEDTASATTDDLKCIKASE